MRQDHEHLSPIARQIWEQKYRLSGALPVKGAHGARKKAISEDRSIEDSWHRVAKAAASVEAPDKRKHWEKRFYEAMEDFAFIPAGRILAGAGTGRAVTLFNCFVMGGIEDDMASIFDNLKQAALTMQQGGGIGHDFSTLRPKGAPVRNVGADASGPVSFMDVWDAMCRTIKSAGSRRGAMMAVLACDHPDIEDFIAAKGDPTRLRMFNLSVLVSDAFMSAVRNGEDWPLKFGGVVYKTVHAPALWEQIMRSAYDYAEPGVIFIDRINRANNLGYCETIRASNPCGEQPLPPFGACLLGSLNLARLVHAPFTETATIDDERLEALSATAVRLLDNVIDISRYPLPEQKAEAMAKRRIGLGITGLADALAMCGHHYGSRDARSLAQHWMARIEHAAYRASAALAAEKGAFPLFDAERYLEREGAERLPETIRAAIRKDGLRNGLLTSIAPTGTISLLAGNVSSGIEPIFELHYQRRILRPDGSSEEQTVEDYAHKLYRQSFGEARLPDYFVTAHALSPRQHLEMQAALQPYVDAGISKTINCAADISFEDFRAIYDDAYELGLKGCTAYRPNPITGAVLSALPAAQPQEGELLRQAALALPAPPAPPVARAAVGGEILSAPMKRDAVLPGNTYKIRWPGSDHAFYVTINDVIRDGERRPFEIFINSKNLEHYAWTVALTRMISAIFRRGGDVSFVIDELKDVFDPRGGYWMGGTYVPSLLAAIGGIIEQHMIAIGFIAEGRKLAEKAGAVAVGGDLKYCPRCSQPAMVRQEGCLTCRNCGYSTCS